MMKARLLLALLQAADADPDDQEAKVGKILAIFLIFFILLLLLVVYLLSAPFNWLANLFLPAPERSLVQEMRAELGSALSPDYGPITYDLGPYPLPTAGSITSPYGYRVHPVTGAYRIHTGTDFATGWHGNIISIADGQVVEVGLDPDVYGQYVLIKHYDAEMGAFYTFYAHLAEILAWPDMEIIQGDVIGLQGGDPELDPIPGVSTGAHLHFEIRTGRQASTHTDPTMWIFRPPPPPKEEEEIELVVEGGNKP